MNVFKGNLSSGQVRGPSYTTTFMVKKLAITNKTASTVYINLFVVAGNKEIIIAPPNIELREGYTYTDKDIVIAANENLLLKSTGEVDYYFSII